jgi:trimethylamine--corrinoid protein Co-methyltransferase
MPSLAGAFGTEAAEPGTWQAAADVALDPLLATLAGADWATGIGLNDSYTLLYPEAIILDDDLYHRARYSLMDMEVDPETVALDVIEAVGPGGHFLGQKHTRKHMRLAMKPALTHRRGQDGRYRDPVEVARERVDWILSKYQPEPLEEANKRELKRILDSADRELN